MDGYQLRYFMETMSRMGNISELNGGEKSLRRLVRPGDYELAAESYKGPNRTPFGHLTLRQKKTCV